MFSLLVDQSNSAEADEQTVVAVLVEQSRVADTRQQPPAPGLACPQSPPAPDGSPARPPQPQPTPARPPAAAARPQQQLDSPTTEAGPQLDARGAAARARSPHEKGEIFPSSRAHSSPKWHIDTFLITPLTDKLLLSTPRVFLGKLKNRPGSHGTGRFTGSVENRPVQWFLPV